MLIWHDTRHLFKGSRTTRKRTYRFPNDGACYKSTGKPKYLKSTRNVIYFSPLKRLWLLHNKSPRKKF